MASGLNAIVLNLVDDLSQAVAPASSSLIDF